MEKNKIIIESENLEKDVEIAVYGHFGFTVMLFSTFADNTYENEENGLIESIYPLIKKGKIKLYSVPLSNMDSWYSAAISSSEKSHRHYLYNVFITEELIPMIYDTCGSIVPIITAGASFGAYQAANQYFRRPDLFLGTIAMSGFYNIDCLTNGYFDDNCYFNSPTHYLPNLNDNYWLTFLKSRHHVYLTSGSGNGERPWESTHLANILSSKGIPHLVNILGEEFDHSVDTWKIMLPQLINYKL